MERCRLVSCPCSLLETFLLEKAVNAHAGKKETQGHGDYNRASSPTFVLCRQYNCFFFPSQLPRCSDDDDPDVLLCNVQPRVTGGNVF